MRAVLLWLSPLVSVCVLVFTLPWWSAAAHANRTPRPSSESKTERPRQVRIAAVQMPSRLGDVKGNSARIERLARQAARHGARVVVFPEAALTGYLSQDLKVNWHINGYPLAPEFRGRSPAGAAQRVRGPAVRRFARLSRELKIYLVLPFVEVDRRGKYYNSAVLLGPDGRQLLHYRKIHPWPHPEDSWATPGTRLAVARTPLGRLGLLICYDIHSLPVRLAAAGADILLYPIAWVDDPGSSWFAKELPAIARRHRVAIVGANWSVESAQKSHDWYGAGQSRIIDRSGRILARAWSGSVGEQILYADLEVQPPP